MIRRMGQSDMYNVDNVIKPEVRIKTQRSIICYLNFNVVQFCLFLFLFDMFYMKTAVIGVHLYFGIYATLLTSERVTFNSMFRLLSSPSPVPNPSPNSRSQIQFPDPKSKVLKKGTGTGADTIILQATHNHPPTHHQQ